MTERRLSYEMAEHIAKWLISDDRAVQWRQLPDGFQASVTFVGFEKSLTFSRWGGSAEEALQNLRRAVAEFLLDRTR